MRPGATGPLSLLSSAERDEWVSAHANEIRAWTRLDGDLARHEYRLGQAAAYSPPGHTAAVLGPLPERMSRAERWQCAAGAIEAYRDRWNVTAADALGPEPSGPEQRDHWQRAADIIGSAGFSDPGCSGRESDEGWLSSLWDRVNALETERLDPSRDVSSIPESPQLEWRRDDDFDYGHDLDDGFGL